MHSLLAPRDLHNTRVQKLEHKLQLDLGSSPGRYPDPQYEQSSWLTSHKTQSLDHKDMGRHWEQLWNVVLGASL